MNKVKRYQEDLIKPCRTIKTTLMIWIISSLTANMIIYYTEMSLLKYPLIIATLLVYFITIKKIKMSLKEKHFLREFSVYPILMTIIGLFSSNNINSVYSSIPLSLIVVVAALNYIYSYFHDKKMICLMVINVVFIILVLVIDGLKMPFINNVISLSILFIASLMMKEEL